MTHHMLTATAIYAGTAALIYAAWGAAPFWWFTLGGCVLVLVVVTVEALRSHQ